MNILIYDIEIRKAILGKRETVIDGIEYCEGWHDHANMGISCIGAYDYATQRYRVFMEDNIDEFFESVKRADKIVGFNNIAFDNSVIRATYPNKEFPADGKSYDLLVEIWKASGLSPVFKYPSHTGFGLDAVCEKNFGINKTGNGAFAPVLFQRREYGQLIDYCQNDVAMTKRLLDHVIESGEILSPKDGSLLKIPPLLATTP